jgi:hypothetical protein
MTDHSHDPSDADLRFRLRQLPRELEPARDLWPGIAGRLQPAPRRRARSGWFTGLALAASVSAAVVGWRMAAPANDPAPAPGAVVMQAEADAMTREYQAALAEYRTLDMPADAEPGLEALDRSARDIRTALAASPDSVRLLQMLQRTYTRRLELTHRAATG